MWEFLSLLFGTRARTELPAANQQDTNVEGHSISASSALMPTDEAVIRPTMSGSWSSLRTQPIIAEPRYFTELETKSMVEQAKNRVKGAKNTVKTYRALSAMEQADAMVHTAHRGYQAQMAKGEMQKLKSNAQLAKTLHGLRPGYTAAQLMVSGAEQRASNRVVELKAKYLEAMQ